MDVAARLATVETGIAAVSRLGEDRVRERKEDGQCNRQRGAGMVVAWTATRSYVRAMDVPFNTHAFVKRLTNAGFTEPQAEALSDTVHQAVTGGVATKADIAETKADIAELRVGLRWVTGIGAAIVAILVGASGFGFNMLVGMNADIAALQTAVGAQGQDIAALQTAISAQGQDIAAIKEALEALTAAN